MTTLKYLEMAKTNSYTPLHFIFSTVSKKQIVLFRSIMESCLQTLVPYEIMPIMPRHKERI